jgi:hypothetical protein
LDRKIVLPNGQFTPRSIPGRYIKERIDEWHKRNPSTSTSSSLMYEISPILMPADTPLAPSPRVDRSRPKRSDIYRSSTQNADATTLRTPKVDDILLSILTIATPGDRGLSHL